MILHIGSLDKFIPSFIEFVNKEFSSEKHTFFMSEATERYHIKVAENTLITKRGILNRTIHYLKLIPKMHRSEKIILHGLFDIYLILLLFCMPWLLPKCYWTIWGGDLYVFKKQKNSIREKIKEKLRAFVIERVGYLITYIPGDIDLARSWYNARGEHRECIMYLSNVISPEINCDDNKKYTKNKEFRILLGNSADPSNEHFDALDKLARYKDDPIQIIVPLSYGDLQYARKVIKYGKFLFGERFIPLTTFIPISEYVEILKSIDISIFNHQRQQAMGNIITLLAMGKTVFMRKNVTHYSFFEDAGLLIRDVDCFNLNLIAETDSHSNAKLARQYFSREKLKSQLQNIFEE